MNTEILVLCLLLIMTVNIFADENAENERTEISEKIENSIFPSFDLIYLYPHPDGFEGSNGDIYEDYSYELKEIISILPSAGKELEQSNIRRKKGLIYAALGGLIGGTGLLFLYTDESLYSDYNPGFIASISCYVAGVTLLIMSGVNFYKSQQHYNSAINNYNNYVLGQKPPVTENVLVDENTIVTNSEISEDIEKSVFPSLDLIFLYKYSSGFQGSNGEVYGRNSPELAELMATALSADMDYKLYTQKHNKSILYGVLGGLGLGVGSVLVMVGGIEMFTDLFFPSTNENDGAVKMGVGGILYAVGIPLIVACIVNSVRSRRHLNNAVDNYNNHLKEQILE